MTTRKPGILRRILSFFWRLIGAVRSGLSNLLFLALLAIVISTLIPAEMPTIPERTALRIAPGGMLVDEHSRIDPIAQLLNQSPTEELETVVSELVKALQLAKTDERITALVLDLTYLQGGGISKLSEVGSALADFRTSGKPVMAVSDTYSQDQYFLASYADEIFLNPMGGVMLTGYGSYRNYFRDALDKLQLNVHVFRVGEFKDAVEPFLQNSMSTASREHNSQWLNELWSTYTAQVEGGRKLPPGSLNDYVNNMGAHLARVQGDSARLAKEAGLVDQLASPNQIEAILRERLGSSDDGSTYQAIDYFSYLHYHYTLRPDASDRIGVLVAQGTIIDGESAPGTIGGDTLVNLIRQVREDDAIKALVVRIDSGGGSAFASELIREELQAARDDGLPVVVSMGSVAASGGYWMAMAADEVWATPTTITGSIGVFSAFPTVENSLSEMGIHTDGVGTTALAGAMRIDRPLDDNTRAILQLGVDNIYQKFLNLVAASRASTPEAIHKVAQGHVWTGARALELGLVDQLGSLDEAIVAAADQAGVNNYEVEIVREALSPGQQLLEQLTGSVSSHIGAQISSHWTVPALVQQLWSPLLQTATRLQQMNDPRGLYVQCLECLAP